MNNVYSTTTTSAGEPGDVFIYIADRLRQLREHKNLSQGDSEQRTGLLRCYISRVENGHTVPALETLEKFARALEVLLYQLFCKNEDAPRTELPSSVREKDWASQGKGFRIFTKLGHALSRIRERDRQILAMAA